MGVMFYELLAGKLPDGRYKLSELRPDLPKGVDDLFEKATAADPNERFESAQAFHDALFTLYEQDKEQAGKGRKNGRNLLTRPLGWLKKLFGRR